MRFSRRCFCAWITSEAIFDPALAPDDFLNFLATWVAASIDENWPVERQRAFIAQSVMLDRRRGTLAGLTDYIEALTDLPVEATDNGGVAYSRTPERCRLDHLSRPSSFGSSP